MKLAVVLVAVWACKNESKAEAPPPVVAPSPAISTEPAKSTGEPAVYSNEERDQPARDRTEKTMRAVFERCAAKNVLFREGSHVRANHVDAMGKYPELVNVAIDLARPETADGNTLWYQVDLTKKPATVTATKDIAASLCDLPGRENPVPL